jgi:hypothetical protein
MQEPVTTLTGCPVCLELVHPDMTVLSLVDNGRGRVLSSSIGWALMPSLGALGEHHLLLVPRNHYRSIARAWSKLDQAAPIELISLMRKKLDPGSALIFEHGEPESGPARTGACIDHAHLHILPGMGRFLDRVATHFQFDTTYRSLEDAMLEADRNGYHLIGAIGEETEIHLRSISGPVPSQFLRRIIARAIGTRDSWDWRADWKVGEVEHTCRIWRIGEPLQQS